MNVRPKIPDAQPCSPSCAPAAQSVRLLDAGFTIMEHEMLDSIAGRLLSGGARSAILDFRRVWLRESHNGKLPVHAVIWTWTGCCDWAASRKTYGRYQRELVKRGFVTLSIPTAVLPLRP